VAPDPARHPVVVRAVTVHYRERPAPALDRVDLTIRPGELLAVTGPSGAGKTTLGRVLLGLTRPDSGAVLVDNLPLTTMDPGAWRDRVAWAPQHPTLVAGTVSENIALGRPAGPLDPADARRVEAAARHAGADAFARRLPRGYATPVGPGGHGLSAGERQRLGLARALIQDAGLLVLDEPTAHLDPVVARVVTAAISAARGTRTIVVLTHDATLAARADRRVRLVDGRLGEDVTEPELEVVRQDGVPAAAEAAP
jgi:ABC-type multidrug transport system fused ATPase/permease subunit